MRMPHTAIAVATALASTCMPTMAQHDCVLLRKHLHADADAYDLSVHVYRYMYTNICCKCMYICSVSLHIPPIIVTGCLLVSLQYDGCMPRATPARPLHCNVCRAVQVPVHCNVW